MNASRPPFSLTVRSAALLGACAVVSACSHIPFTTETKVDPNSAVAADVTRVTRLPDQKFPGFASIPAKPTDLRPVAQYGNDAKQVAAQGEALIAATEPNTWTLQGTDLFAEKGRQAAGPEIEPVKPGESEAFARALRERATPPPPR